MDSINKPRFNLFFDEAKNNPPSVINNFKVGDIILEKQTSNLYFSYPIAFLTIFLQKVARKLGRLLGNHKSLTQDYTNVTHVFQVVAINKQTGQLLVADAMPAKNVKCRIIDLWKDHSTQFTKGLPYEYEVVRLKDEKLAEASVRAITHLAQKASYLLEKESKTKPKAVTSSFSKLKGFKAIFKKPVVHITASEKKRLMKKAIDQLMKTPVATGGKKTPRSYFCSYFVADQLLGSQLVEAFYLLIKELTLDQQKNVNTLISKAWKESEGLSYRNSKGHLSHLATQFAKDYGDRFVEILEKMDSVLKINVEVKEKGKNKIVTRIIDPKHTSPQLLANILHDPNVAKTVGTIVPPKK